MTASAAIEKKLCLACGKTLKGRVDKKFCDDYCRNNYNNQLKAHSSNLVRNINNAIGKNRRILESLLPEKRQDIKVTRDKLIFMGFCFDYFTNTHINLKGDIHFFCYDYGFRKLENNKYLIMRSSASVRKSRELNSEKDTGKENVASCSSGGQP